MSDPQPTASQRARSEDAARATSDEGSGGREGWRRTQGGGSALRRAVASGAAAARLGFDWSRAVEVIAKVEEEAREVREACAGLAAGGSSAAAIGEEVGDLLFAVANLARKLGVEPEAALHAAVVKFEGRFEGVLAGLEARGQAPGAASVDEMEALWREVKRQSAAEEPDDE